MSTQRREIRNKSSNNSNYDLDHFYELLNDYEINPRKDDTPVTACRTKPKQRVIRNRILFPKRLYNMLEDVSDEKSNSAKDVVSWISEGGFMVHNKELFETLFLPKYFHQTKIRSFQRQLNIYGFKRIEHGKYEGGYQNKFFIRGPPHLIERIERVPIKGHCCCSTHCSCV